MPTEPRLTPRLEHQICDLVAQGVALIDIAHGLGLGPRTVYRWCALGRQEREPIYARFVDGLAAAQAERRYQVEQLIADAQLR